MNNKTSVKTGLFPHQELRSISVNQQNHILTEPVPLSKKLSDWLDPHGRLIHRIRMISSSQTPCELLGFLHKQEPPTPRPVFRHAHSMTTWPRPPPSEVFSSSIKDHTDTRTSSIYIQQKQKNKPTFDGLQELMGAAGGLYGSTWRSGDSQQE